MEIKVKDPWPKVRFKTDDGVERDGYLYHILADAFYISTNSSWSTIGMAENWVIHFRNVQFDDAKYGLRCSCGADNVGSLAHTCACKWQTINTDLL